MTENSLRIAAIVTTFFANSHAGVLVPKFLRGFPTDNGLIPPRTQIASIYIDQIHQHDVGCQLANEYGVPLFESVRAALTLGGSKLAVDAVLLIGEHGDYPRSPIGQEMLPRRYLFEQICGTVIEAKHPIPVFCDKHLAYTWADASWMYNTATTLKIPFWAGSAVPVAWRRPNLEHPLDTPLDDALTIGFHMLERYGFHAIESLQCQVERRRGGETGVESVQCLSGKAVWKAGKQGQWPIQLACKALNAIEDGPTTLDPNKIEDPHVFLIKYIDGLSGTVLMLGDTGYVNKFAYAGTGNGCITSLEYHTDSGPANAVFSYLGLNIEDFFLSGVTPSPVERTYLTTGILESLMISNNRNGQLVPTPHLGITYKPSIKPPRRPSRERPTGSSIDEWPMPKPGATPKAKIIPINRDGTIRGK